MSQKPTRTNKKDGSNLLIVLFCTVIAVCLALMGVFLSEKIEEKKATKSAVEAVTLNEEKIILPLLPIRNEEDEIGVDSGNFNDMETAAAGTTKNPSATSASGSSETVTVNRMHVDFASLRKTNEDIVGWLNISGTTINYPVVQANGLRDAAYYLNHLYDGKTNSAGTLYIESGMSADFSDRINIIRGHRMNNGSMFGGLSKYAKASYFNQHPIGQLSTPEQDYYIYFFAAYETDVDEVMPSNPGDAEFQNYVEQAVAKSAFTAGFTPRASDKIITLSTCVVRKDTRRFFLHGILIPIS